MSGRSVIGDPDILQVLCVGSVVDPADTPYLRTGLTLSFATNGVSVLSRVKRVSKRAAGDYGLEIEIDVRDTTLDIFAINARFELRAGAHVKVRGTIERLGTTR